MSAASPGWGIYEIARSQDPYPAWDALRAQHPVLDVGDGLFFVSSWKAVDRALRHPALRAGSGVTQSLGVKRGRAVDVTQRWLMALDGDAHTRARGLVSREFTARRVAELEPFLRELAEALVGAFVREAAQGPSDFVARVAQRLPSQVIRHLFGIEREVWLSEVDPLFAIAPVAAPGEEAPAAPDPMLMIDGLASFFDARCASREAIDAEHLRSAGARDVPGREHARSAATSNAKGGLLGKLLEPDEDGTRLSRDEAVANAVLLASAAIDTTTGLIANALLCLLRTPQAWAALRAERSLVGAAVEETLRFEPPALSCSRHAPTAIELGGVAIPAGSHLLLGLAAANRDPAKYADPNRFVLEREHAGALGFGGGRHFCLGAALARLEARVVLEALLDSRHSFRVDEPVRWRSDNPTIRAPRSLVVRAQQESH